MPDARRDLAALGVHWEPGDGALFRGIRFIDWTDREPVSASADFASGEGIGMRRTALHARLVERALEAGVRLRWNTHVALGNSVSLGREACRYGFLVGADGQSSRVRRWAGLDSCRLISRRFGFRRHYRMTAISDFVEVHWCGLGQVYITPVAPEEICVAVVTRHNSARMQEIIDTIPPLCERLQAKEAVTPERGALTTTRRLRRVVKGNVALIGDASGSVDAVTGEGLAIGFRQADLLSRSLAKGSFDLYAAEHDKTLRMPRRMARGLLLADRHASMRKGAMHVLARSPELCHGLLQVHMGEESLPHLMLHRAVGIVRGLAFAGIPASDSERTST